MPASIMHVGIVVVETGALRASHYAHPDASGLENFHCNLGRPLGGFFGSGPSPTESTKSLSFDNR